MSSQKNGRRRLKVTAEVTMQIIDDAVLRADVRRAAESWNDGGNEPTPPAQAGLDDQQMDQAVAENDAPGDVQRDAGDFLDKFLYLVDPYRLAESEGLEVSEAKLTAVELDVSGHPVLAWPDFADLFGSKEQSAHAGEQSAIEVITPRTGAALWISAQLLADRAYDDVEAYGDEPVDGTGFWQLFHDYPRITWQQDALWRRQAARSFDDLAADLAEGNEPRPTCPAEEMALHLMVDLAREDMTEGGWGETLTNKIYTLPRDSNDFMWDGVRETLLQDQDILELFDDERDGIEDPGSAENSRIGMGDYRPQAWFRPFLNAQARDPRRRFRR